MESILFNTTKDSDSGCQSNSKKWRKSMLPLKPQQFKVARVPRDVLLSRLGSQDCFLENNQLSTAGDNKSQNSGTERTLIVRRFKSVLNTGAADSAVSKVSEKLVVPQKRKAIPAPLRKPETSSLSASPKVHLQEAILHKSRY
ncbi:unnamed protein product [Orchesella dallaii]|uniref:Uncharacterized protein n=1 Tax=Orchesella dallaii TaxID=48710 RepID=A0ABP1RKM3_9HEXA